MKLQLIRHGATESNESRRYLGRTDEPLSTHGMMEVQRKKQDLWYHEADFVAVSPMKRCLQTAELIYGGSPSFLSEKWKEIDFGLWEGKTYLDLQRDSDYQRWIDSGGMLPFPFGESREEFTSRCNQGFQNFCEVLRIQKQPVRTAALIVHGGTIMSILSNYSSEDYYTFQCKNAEGYLCELEITNGITLHQITKLKGMN